MTRNDLEALSAWLGQQPGIAGTTIVQGPLPASPDLCIGITEYPGPPVPNWQGDYRVQLMCRGAAPGSMVSTWATVVDLAQAVLVAVAPAQDGQRVISLAGGHRAIMRLVSGPLPLGPDDSGRERISINIALETSRV